MQNRFIFRQDLRPDQTWELANWCLSVGADEFTVELMSLVGTSPTYLDEVESALSAFALPDTTRERTVTLVGQPRARPTRLWKATPASLAVLRQFFADGLFDIPNDASDSGWLEDPTFYRDGDVILAIVSHEGEGFVRLTELEHVQLAARHLPTRAAAKWI